MIFDNCNVQVYWPIVLKELSVTFREDPKCALDTSNKTRHGGVWFPGAVLNIAECCLLQRNSPKKRDEDVAVVWRDEGHDDSPVNRLLLRELRDRVMYVELSTFISSYAI